MRLLILGAGGHAQVVADCLLAQAPRPNAPQPIGYLDDDPARQGQVLLGLPVLGALRDLPALAHDGLVVGIGHNPTRREIFERLQRQGECLVTVIHPAAVVSPFAVLGRGSVLCAGVIVNPGVVVGDNVILNTGCGVDHHCQIEAHSHIGPGARLAGAVRVGEGTLVGVGAVVRPGQALGAWSVIGAGAVVVADVQPGATVVGIPARPFLRDNK